MFERMSIAQARVNVFMKSFCEKRTLRARLWSPRNNDVAYHTLKFFQILKNQKTKTQQYQFQQSSNT
jgi:hypothetical protein